MLINAAAIEDLNCTIIGQIDIFSSYGYITMQELPNPPTAVEYLAHHCWRCINYVYGK